MTTPYSFPNPDLDDLRALPDVERGQAVTSLFRECAETFLRAEAAKDYKVVQEAIMGGLKVLSGLFPDRRDPSLDMLASMIMMMFDIREGSNRNPILNHRAPMHGAARGMGRVEMGAFAIAMASLAFEMQMFASKAECWKGIANLISDAGVNIYAGREDRFAPVSSSTVRRWVLEVEEHASQHQLASGMVPIHRENLRLRGIDSLPAFLAYFREAADEAMQRWMQSDA